MTVVKRQSEMQYACNRKKCCFKGCRTSKMTGTRFVDPMSHSHCLWLAERDNRRRRSVLVKACEDFLLPRATQEERTTSEESEDDAIVVDPCEPSRDAGTVDALALSPRGVKPVSLKPRGEILARSPRSVKPVAPDRSVQEKRVRLPSVREDLKVVKEGDYLAQMEPEDIARHMRGEPVPLFRSPAASSSPSPPSPELLRAAFERPVQRKHAPSTAAEKDEVGSAGRRQGGEHDDDAPWAPAYEPRGTYTDSTPKPERQRSREGLRTLFTHRIGSETSDRIGETERRDSPPRRDARLQKELRLDAERVNSSLARRPLGGDALRQVYAVQWQPPSHRSLAAGRGQNDHKAEFIASIPSVAAARLATELQARREAAEAQLAASMASREESQQAWWGWYLHGKEQTQARRRRSSLPLTFHWPFSDLRRPSSDLQLAFLSDLPLTFLSDLRRPSSDLPLAFL